jgi:hypothetical protein
MHHKPGEDRMVYQNAAKTKGNVNQVAGNNTQTTNVSVWISVLLVLTLGGLAYVGVRVNMRQGAVDVKIENKQPAQ